jgi:long-chain fatty acid transport protein
MKRRLLLLALLPSMLFAGGFQLNTQSVKALGLGGAFTGWGNTASTVFFNPGAMYQLTGYQFSGGLHYIMPSVSLQTETNYNINQTTGNANPIHFYFTGQIGEKLTVGFQVNNQFGSSSSFEDAWEGRYIVQNISLKTFMFQPTVSYRIHEKLGIGAGFVFSTGSFSYEKAVPVSSSDNLYGKARLEGKGKAFGYNIGLHSNIVNNDTWDIGLGVSYRSGLNINLPEGTATFTNIPSSLRDKFPESTSFEAKLSLPSVTSAGVKVGYAVSEKLELSFLYDFNYTGWKSYDTLSFDFTNENTPDSESVKNWQNTVTHRIGLDLTLNEKFSFRGGVTIDETPIQEGYLSPELPDTDLVTFSAGFGMQVNEMISFDLSFVRQNAELQGTLAAASFSATYRRQVNVVGIGVNINLKSGFEKASAPSFE